MHILLTRVALGAATFAITLAPWVAGAAESLPDVVVLDRIVKFYDSVEFDHAGHLDLADGCASCHHHTTGSAPESESCATCHREGEPTATVQCADCHAADPFTAEYLAAQESGPQWFHVDKPGLKGAYHRSCLGCHQKVGGPTGCQDCHSRTAAGDVLFSAQAGQGATTGAAGGHN